MVRLQAPIRDSYWLRLLRCVQASHVQVRLNPAKLKELSIEVSNNKATEGALVFSSTDNRLCVRVTLILTTSPGPVFMLSG